MEQEIRELQGNSPHSLISQALAQGSGIETLERLMDLQERYDKAQAKKSFLEAMSNFQSAIPELKKKKTVNYPSKAGGSVKYNYAPLSSIIKEIQPHLKDFGLSYRWEFEENELIKCQCILSHIDGHSETSTMQAGKDTTGNKNDIQSIGSTRQYLQRYTLIAALGLSTAENDDDGGALPVVEVVSKQNALNEYKIKVNEFTDFAEYQKLARELINDAVKAGVLLKDAELIARSKVADFKAVQNETT